MVPGHQRLESIIHKSAAERQSLRGAPHIGVTTVRLLAWPPTAAREQLREPVAYMPEMSGCEATVGREVRWKELVRSAARSSQMSRRSSEMCGLAMSSEGHLVTLDKCKQPPDS